MKLQTNHASRAEQLSDASIISGVLAGETGLYEIIIRRYNAYLYKTARTYGYGHEDAEDLMQETYINAYTQLSQFEFRASFKAWLIRIMLHNCYRKKLKFSFIHEIPGENIIQEKSVPMFTSQPGDTVRTVISREFHHILENALLQLSDDYRMVFLLRELNGLSVTETAETLHISESNVKVRLNRAKKMLRNEIETIYSPEDIFEFNLIYCDRIVSRVMAEIEIL